MHPNDLMNPDLLSEIVLETYADVLSRPGGARLGKFPRTRNGEVWLRWGLTNQEIAWRLKPSEHTVNHHVHRILRKTRHIRSHRDCGTPPRVKRLIPLQSTHCVVKPCLELNR